MHAAILGKSNMRDRAPWHFLHTLHIYGAAGIALFGWALARQLHFPPHRLVPLWFAGALLVYNLDRLKHDPADAINTPLRQRRHASFRKTSRVLVFLSAVVLLALPARAHDWRLLAWTIGASLVSASYSFPILGFRGKDLPLLKTLFAPALVALAYFVPPWCQGELASPVLPAMAWTFLYLIFNMTLCDLRDFAGDARLGTKSLPVLLGRRGTFLFLWVLLAALLVFALLKNWPLLATVTTLYLGALLIALRRPRSEAFYEWFVEGMLLLPPAVWLGAPVSLF